MLRERKLRCGAALHMQHLSPLFIDKQNRQAELASVIGKVYRQPESTSRVDKQSRQAESANPVGNRYRQIGSTNPGDIGGRQIGVMPATPPREMFA